MELQSVYSSREYSVIKPGEFFVWLESDATLCFKCQVAGRDATLMFRDNPRKGGSPWISQDSFPEDATVLSINKAILRVDHNSAASPSMEAPTVGCIVSHGDKALVLAAAGGAASKLYFDLSSGHSERAIPMNAGVIYFQWSIGTLVDDVYASLFTVDAGPPSEH